MVKFGFVFFFSSYLFLSASQSAKILRDVRVQLNKTEFEQVLKKKQSRFHFS